MKRHPTLNNLVVSKRNPKKILIFFLNHMLVLVFSDPCVFIFEITPTQLIEPHSLTARPTQASLCTCLRQNGLLSVHANHV
jgi:hypothetical protein